MVAEIRSRAYCEARQRAGVLEDGTVRLLREAGLSGRLDREGLEHGGIFASGTGARFGGTANLDAFTDTRWVTMRGDIAPYPF